MGAGLGKRQSKRLETTLIDHADTTETLLGVNREIHGVYRYSDYKSRLRKRNIQGREQT